MEKFMKPKNNETLLNFIDGDFAANQSGKTFDVFNPATGELLYVVEEADKHIREIAIDSAKRAFKLWSQRPAVERSRILLCAVSELRKRNNELARIECLDTGKPLQETTEVDVATGADVLEFFACLAPTQTGQQQSVGDDFYYTRKEPLGICAGIGAWNYPLQIACWKSAPALAAGNTMIFKPSEKTPRGATELAKVFIDAGVPPGVFNVVHGEAEVGAWLTGHKDIAKVSFTGEVGTGRKVMEGSASTLKDVTMELGGKSPLLVFDDADIEEAISGAMLGNFYSQGEVCTNCTRVYVHDAIYDTFLVRLKERTEQNIIAGDPLDLSTNFGAMISKEHHDLVMGYIQKGKFEGAKLLTGGDSFSPDSAPKGYFIQPTVFIDCTDNMTICREEIFGPVMSVLRFYDEDEVIRRANDSAMGLAAGVMSKDIRRAHRVAQQLQAGICWINSYGTSPAEMPVGGFKMSGVGRENGIETLDQYTQTKSVYVGMIKLESPF